MVDDAVEPPGPARRGRQNIGGEPLCEDLLAAQYGLAPEAARNDHQLDASSRQRQVADPTMVPTVHAPRSGTAGWTCRRYLRRTNRDRGVRDIVDCNHNNKTAGYQREWPQRLMHGADSPSKTAHRSQQTSSKVSQIPKSIPCKVLLAPSDGAIAPRGAAARPRRQRGMAPFPQ